MPLSGRIPGEGPSFHASCAPSLRHEVGAFLCSNNAAKRSRYLLLVTAYRGTSCTYWITFRPCRASIVEDERSFSTLAADLAQDGFIVVRRQASGYSQTKTQPAVVKRAVESIEPTVDSAPKQKNSTPGSLASQV